MFSMLLKGYTRMTKWLNKPVIYEINTAVWLTSLSQRYDRKITLGNVPSEVLDELSLYNIDTIWLMGIWTRSKAVRESALNYMHEYTPVLPDLTEEDVIGSAYAIGAYAVDPRLGGRDELAILREQLRHHGMKLILDYVPNHVAVDHAWVRHNPDYLVCGTKEQFEATEGIFFDAVDENGNDIYVGHGRDPNFAGWIDTAQVNAFSEGYRQVVRDLLLEIASQCDGVRCDMAMLMTNNVFTRTWGEYLDMDAPSTEYWEDIIPTVKAKYPDFAFIAEVYWSMEYEMLQQGFDFTYDKTLYDRIVEGHVPYLRDHLLAPISYQQHQVRFIENHDEPRAKSAIGLEKSRAAATLILTLPGATLLHDGQFTAREKKLPVQISRQPDEPVHVALDGYYKRLLKETCKSIYQDGTWRLLDVESAGEGIDTHANIIAYGWGHGQDLRLVLVNLTYVWSQGVIKLGEWHKIFDERWVLHDVLTNNYRFHDDDFMSDNGLYVELEAYQSYIFQLGVNGRKT